MKVAGWKAWYTKNRVYRSDVDDWGSIPKVGVLAVIVFFDEHNAGNVRYREILSGNRRYFMARGSSGELFIKSSLWKENKLISTYDTKPEWIKEGVWDDDETVARVKKEAMDTKELW